MTWWGWIMFGAYLLCALYSIPRIAYVIAYDFGRPDGADVAFAYFFGLISCAAWPVIWGGYAWHHHAKGRNYSGMLVAPRPIRHAKQREQMQRRIRDLEREVGIS